MTRGTAMALSPTYIQVGAETAMANFITRDKTSIAPTTRHGFFGLVGGFAMWIGRCTGLRQRANWDMCTISR